MRRRRRRAPAASTAPQPGHTSARRRRAGGSGGGTCAIVPHRATGRGPRVPLRGDGAGRARWRPAGDVEQEESRSADQSSGDAARRKPTGRSSSSTWSTPGPGEVLVEMAYAGMCHSDEHLRHGPGVRPDRRRARGLRRGPGRGAGRHLRGAGRPRRSPASCPPAGTAGTARAGKSNLCDKGATIGTGQLPSGTFPFRLDGEPLGGFCMVGAFARHSVLSEFSCVRIDPSVALDTAALLACSVPDRLGLGGLLGRGEPGRHRRRRRPRRGGRQRGAGRGARRCAARHRRRPGRDEARVRRVARRDPHGGRRRGGGRPGPQPVPRHGRRRRHPHRREADRRGLRRCDDLPRQGRDDGAHRARPTSSRTASSRSTGRWPRCTSSGSRARCTGRATRARDIPRLLQMHEEGRLELDRLITRRYSLDELNQGYRDQAAGEIVRGLLVRTTRFRLKAASAERRWAARRAHAC